MQAIFFLAEYLSGMIKYLKHKKNEKHQINKPIVFVSAVDGV